jgi:hypothetical protein
MRGGKESESAPDRRWTRPVAAVTVVALGLTLAAVAVLFVFGTGSGCACQPEPGVEVTEASNGSALTVTYITARSEPALLVTVEATDGSVSLAGTDGNATATADGARLAAVGDSATFAEDDPATETTVRVEVVAVAEDADRRTVVADRTLTL